jgi:hypothetical protein
VHQSPIAGPLLLPAPGWLQVPERHRGGVVWNAALERASWRQLAGGADSAARLAYAAGVLVHHAMGAVEALGKGKKK